MDIDLIHKELEKKDWKIEELGQFDYALIADVAEVVEKQLTIPRVMQWVAIEDALPPVELDVLVWDEFNIYITNRLDSNFIVWDESTQILDGVTHWMYLPEPPCA